MTDAREEFAITVNSETLATVRALAAQQGQPIHALVDEALADLVEKHTRARPRPYVMEAYETSHARYGSLYQKLAK